MGYLGFRGMLPILEKQLETKLDNAMEAGVL